MSIMNDFSLVDIWKVDDRFLFSVSSVSLDASARSKDGYKVKITV
jgi:hypothetical protein